MKMKLMFGHVSHLWARIRVQLQAHAERLDQTTFLRVDGAGVSVSVCVCVCNRECVSVVVCVCLCLCMCMSVTCVT